MSNFWRIGSRWSNEGAPETEILDVFLKMRLVFLGKEEYRDKFLCNVKKGDCFVVTSGQTVKAIAVANSDAFNLFNMDFEYADEDVKSETYTDFDFEDAASYAVGCRATIFLLQEKDVFQINRGSTFSRFNEKSETEIRNRNQKNLQSI